VSTCIEYVSLCFPVSFLFVSFAFAAKKGFLPNYLRVRRMCLLYLPNRKVQSAAFLLKALGDTLRRIVRRASCSLLPPWGLLTMAPYDASEDLVLHRGAACCDCRGTIAHPLLWIPHFIRNRHLPFGLQSL
jgi:hypothetical protein